MEDYEILYQKDSFERQVIYIETPNPPFLRSTGGFDAFDPWPYRPQSVTAFTIFEWMMILLERICKMIGLHQF